MSEGTAPRGEDASDRWEGEKKSLGQSPRVLKQTKEKKKERKEKRNQLVSTDRSNSLLGIHSTEQLPPGIPTSVNPQPIPRPSSAAPPTLLSQRHQLLAAAAAADEDPLQDGGDRDPRKECICGRSREGWGRGGEGGRPKTIADAARAHLPRGRPEPRAPTLPPTHPDALTSSSSQSLCAWYWNRGRPPAPPPPPPRAGGAAAGAWAPRGLGPAPSSSGPWPPRRRLASGGAGKDREVLILPVNLWYSEAIGLRALSPAVFGAF